MSEVIVKIDTGNLRAFMDHIAARQEAVSKSLASTSESIKESIKSYKRCVWIGGIIATIQIVAGVALYFFFVRGGR